MLDFKKEDKKTDAFSGNGEEMNIGADKIHTMRKDLEKAEQTEKTRHFQEREIEKEKRIPETESFEKKAGEKELSTVPLPENNRFQRESSGKFSPFLNFSSQRGEQKPALPQAMAKKLAEPAPEKKWKVKRVAVVTVIAIVVLALAGGGYYFWVTRSAQEIPSPQPVVPEPQVEQPPIVDVQKYSTTNPNYFSIETEKLTPGDIKQQLAEVGAEIQQEGIKEPVEFIVTDSGNNPIVFPFFAVYADIKLAPVTSLLSENFSLYILPDGEKARLGLVVEFPEENKESMVSTMGDKEKTLVSDLAFLFLGEEFQMENAVFEDNTFRNFSIRFVNVDAEKRGDLSIDYIVNSDRLIIVTSKDATFMLLEKLSQGEQSGNTVDNL